jgi:hypothetical protein
MYGQILRQLNSLSTLLYNIYVLHTTLMYIFENNGNYFKTYTKKDM